MADNKEVKKIKMGLGHQLMWLILVLVLLPSILISYTSFKSAEQLLYHDAVNELQIISSMQNGRMAQYISQIKLDLQVESARQANSRLLQLLTDAHTNSQLSVKDFVRSNAWVNISEDHGTDLHAYQQDSGYYDVFLIDLKGNVLFSVTGEDDLGINLFTGKYSKSGFSVTVKKVLESGQMSFSDLQQYMPSNNIIAGFFAAVLVDEAGDRIGAIAFQVNHFSFQNILLTQDTSSRKIDTYLVGRDLIMRTDPSPEQLDNALLTKVDYEHVNNWLENQSNQQKVVSRAEFEPSIYRGHSGKEVLGVLQPLRIIDQYYVIVAEEDLDLVYAASKQLGQRISIMLLITAAIVALIVLPITRHIVQPVRSMARAVMKVSNGDLKQRVDSQSSNELGMLATGFNTMLLSLQRNQQDTEKREWRQKAIRELAEILVGEQKLAALSQNIISFLCQHFDAPIGAFYSVREDSIRLTGAYAFTSSKGSAKQFNAGEGLVGQAVLERQPIVLADIPDNYMVIGSGMGNTPPASLSIIPVMWNKKVVAVLEIGTLKALSEDQQRLITTLTEAIGVAVNATTSFEQTAQLLQQTQTQAEELQTREEELQESNGMLEQQSSKLVEYSNELEIKNNALQAQQEELRAANEELESSGAILEERNIDLGRAKLELEKKARDLELSSKYKSEFLANMSHELRTPLNSLLILSKLLADNKKNNLDDKQVKYAQTINDSGNDLLTLINDILDLSKIEAGRMDVHVESINIQQFADDIERKFKALADDKGLEFSVVNRFPQTVIHSDSQKIAQVVKNLLSNAFKFTSKGTVSLTFSVVENRFAEAEKTQDFIQIAVSDSGIGISEDKQQLIFEAFQQADGTTSRQFGGTGLGLSISHELTRLLGGEFKLHSQSGKGSTFYIFIKRHLAEVTAAKDTKPEQIEPLPLTTDPSSTENSISDSVDVQDNQSSHENAQINDDRRNITETDKTVLIIEDDSAFAEILADSCREKGFKLLIAEDGESGLYLADIYKPSAIILDIGLPGINGWQVIDRLKENLQTRHIPVHVMSAEDKSPGAYRSGVVGFTTKPVSLPAINETLREIDQFITEPVKKLLLVEDNKVQRDSIIELIGDDDITIDTSETAKETLALLNKNRYDCVVLDLGLPDMDGAELLKKIRHNKKSEQTPIVIYSGKELNQQEKNLLDKYANQVIIKGARSAEILLDETALFLHRVESQIAPDKQKILHMLHDAESVMKGRRVLVVDDDMRNVFALTTLLREQDMQVSSAQNGRDALQKMEQLQDLDLVLMDIMMPVMDGYETIKNIRLQSQYKDLPIIALTAKAMRGDRAKCIQSGASDYLSKPIDTNKLLSMMRVWLYR